MYVGHNHIFSTVIFIFTNYRKHGVSILKEL